MNIFEDCNHYIGHVMIRNLPLWLIILITLQSSAFGITVPLEVTEYSGTGRLSEPVTYGIPFSDRANITSTTEMKVSTDPGGNNELDAQFRVLSRYNDTPEGSGAIRVVLVDYQSSIGADTSTTYYLHTSGGSGSASGNMAAVDANDIVINTGAMQATISGDSGWFSSVFIDADGDTVIDDQVLGATSSDGWLVRSNSGTDYTSWNESNAVSIEENGPLRCVVKVTGYFKDIGGNTLIPANADTGLAYTIRFVFFKDKRFVKIYPRLENENRGWTRDGSANPCHFTYIDYSYLKTTTAVSTSSETVDFGGNNYNGNTSYELNMDEISDGSAQSYTWSHTQSVGGDVRVSDSSQFDSYVDVKDGTIGVMAGLRWFWQQHPKGYRVAGSGNELYIDLWDDLSGDPRGTQQTDSSGNHRILGGLWKTHELIMYFHSGSDSDFANVMATLNNRLVALPSEQYIAQTDFFYSTPPPSWNYQAVDFGDVTLAEALDRSANAHRSMIDPAFITHPRRTYTILDLRDNRVIAGPGSPGYWSWYGIVEFGNFPRSNSTYGYSSVHYGWDYSTLVAFLRFRDFDYLDFAEQLVTHRADISIMHDNSAYQLHEMEAEWHGGHRWEEDALFSFHDTHSLATSATSPRDGSHLWFRGITLQYLLTGEQRFLDAVHDVAEGRKHVYFHKWDCTADCSNYNTIRGAGRSIGALLSHYMVTGDPDSLDKAYSLYKYGLQTEEIAFGNGNYFQSKVGIYESSLLQTSISLEYLIQLHNELRRAGLNVKASEVAASLDKQATWFEETIFSPWITCDDGFLPGTFGTGTHSGEYLPYMVSKLWDTETEWECGHLLPVFLLPYIADLYAWKFNQGGGRTWLDKARIIFKDWHTYGTSEDWVTVAQAPLGNGAFSNINGHAWAKAGSSVKKGLYYLKTEWSLSKEPVRPAAPKNLIIQK